MGLYNAPGGNGSSFVALNPGASLRVDLKPDFKIENWQNSLTADTSNLYYCIRISFRNSITNEEMVHYMIVNAEIGVDVFGSDPDFPSGSSGSFKTEQALQVVQEEIFKNQELIHGDTKSEIY